MRSLQWANARLLTYAFRMHLLLFYLLGEQQEQLRVNFTRAENIERLSCRARNSIGQAEATVQVDILCKRNASLSPFLFLLT